MTIVHVQQGSDEWLQARLGLLTSSGAPKAVSFRKDGKESAERRDYRVQLATERIVLRPCGSDHRNADMDRGTELEPAAIASYEALTGNLVLPVGFCRHDTVLAGYSPDGFVGDDGVIEVKCPRPANHLTTIRSGIVPPDYRPQLLHALWLTGRRWADFISYSPVFPDDLQLFVVRMMADEQELAQYGDEAQVFLRQVNEEVDAIQKLRKVA